jgi:serine/threonine protein kinase
MTHANLDRSVILALLAFQNKFVTRQQLVDAFTVWTRDPNKSLCDMLVDQGSLRKEDRERLEQMLAAFSKQGTPGNQSLELFSTFSTLREELSQIASQSGSQVNGIDYFSRTIEFGEWSQGATAFTAKGGIDRFRIVKEHARGGLGVVFVAEDKQLRREVALKQIRSDRADMEPFRQKFHFEAEVTGQLEHPGIVPIYALGSDDHGRPFYAMRFIQGESLKEGIKFYHQNSSKKSARFDSKELRQLLRRFIDVCNAIDYAHAQGILHRDLKPGNIMLGRHGETLVVDWGLAKAIRPNKNMPSHGSSSDMESEPEPAKGSAGTTRDGGFVGTATYAPPEQLRGELSKLCPASDVYSLGGILFEILTGCPPVESCSSIIEVLTQIDQRQQKGLRDKHPHVPLPLAFVCHKALQSEIADRFNNVAELRDAVQSWLDDQAIPGMKESIRVKSSRWIRNHPTIATSVLVTFISAFVLLGVLTISADSARRENSRRLLIESQLLRDAKEANLELLLKGAQLARSRGKYREAVDNMTKVQELVGLTSEHRLLLACDLARLEKPKLVMSEIQKIDRNQLSLASISTLDLLQGDLQLNTKEAKSGFAAIHRAIASDLLSPADLAYAKSLVALTATECKMHLQECLRLDRLNINAINNLGFTCAVMGEIKEAEAQLAFGQSLYPNDTRLAVLSAFVSAVSNNKEKLKLAFSKLETIGGLENEISAIKITAKMMDLTSGTLLENSMFDPFRLAGLMSELYELRNAQVEIRDVYGLPTLAWMGGFWQAVPGPVDLLTSTPQKIFERCVSQLRVQLPNHQLLLFFAGSIEFMQDRFEQSADLYLQSTLCDPLEEELVDRATWAAFGCLTQHSILSGKPSSRERIDRIRTLIGQQHIRHGKYVTAPFDSKAAWHFLVRVSMSEEALALSEQELLHVDPNQTSEWQTKIDRVKEMEKQISSAINDALTSTKQ